MADNVAITAGSGTSIATDQIGSDHYQLIKLAFGPLDTATIVSTSNGLPVSLLNTSIAVTDNAGSLTIDAPVGTPAFVRLSDGTSAITTLPVSLASVPSHAVTNAGTFAVQVSSAIPTGANVIGAVTQSGTWNVGTVTTVTGVTTVSTVTNLAQLGGQAVAMGTGVRSAGTQRVTVATDDLVPVTGTITAVTSLTNALPAGTNLLGRTSASAETGTIYSGTTALTPKFAAISASSSGDNTVVAAVTSKKIRVLRYHFTSNGTVNAKWKSSTTSDLTGLHYMIQYASAGGSFAPVGLFETVAGEALTLNLSGAVAVGGSVTYIEV